MKQSTDVLIIGGGIIGASIAYFLSKREVDVMVLDKGKVGAQASSAAAGLLAPIRPLSNRDVYKSLLLAGIARLPLVISELEERSGVKTDYVQTGTLRILPPEKVAASHEWASIWKKAGFHIEVLSPEETYVREPLLQPGLSGSVAIAEEAQVTPVHLMQAYFLSATKQGAIFCENTDVVEILRSSNNPQKVTGVRTAQGDVHACNHLIIAAGAWSALCAKWLDISLPICPVRGEIIALKQPDQPIRHILFDEGLYDEDVYITPKPDGTVIVGATKAKVGFDTTVSAGGILHLLDVATHLVPTLKNSPICRMWAGLRPKTDNSHPILGPASSWENVIIASGHGGFGVTLSAITGETIAEVITTGRVPEAIQPFVPKSSYISA